MILMTKTDIELFQAHLNKPVSYTHLDGYIPTSDDKERRREWEDTIKETLMDTSKNGFGFSRKEADHVMKEIQNMDVKLSLIHIQMCIRDRDRVNADMTFDLIGNLGTIDYKTADSKEIIASYER